MNKIIKNKNLKSKIKISKMFSEKDKIIGPKTIYGLTKLCSEMLIEEFSYAYQLKYLINRCGVISGPLQFGKQDQGFVSLWIWRHLNKKKLSYIGYGGYGNQIRDVLHIDDLSELILLQIKNINKINNKLFTVGGSKTSYTSLSQLTKLCQKITGNKIKMGKVSKTSSYDIPYYLSDNTYVSNTYRWKPKRNINQVVMDTFLWLKKNKRIIKKYF
jgi:CDP-paratose 2-epimerase